jgi:hypothetical protein
MITLCVGALFLVSRLQHLFLGASYDEYYCSRDYAVSTLAVANPFRAWPPGEIRGHL